MSAPYAYEHREVLLDLQGVSIARGGVPVLRDLTARIRDVVRPGMSQGQIVGLLGPSGVGKTTLFKILAGLLEPDEGTVRIGAEGRPATPGLVGVVPQNYLLLEHRTVMGNLTLAARQAGMASAEARTKALALLERFGLADHRDRYPVQLSGGQRQRVAIAQQLLCSANYLVMDEPFSGLDVVAQENVFGLMRELSHVHDHNTIIVVTHDVSAAVTISDTIWLMGRDRAADGSIVPGARIVEEIDLMAMGLAWQPELRTDPRYIQLVNDIKARFQHL